MLRAAADEHCLEELAEVKLPATDRWDLEVVVSHLLMKCDEAVFELDALLDFILRVEKLELIRLMINYGAHSCSTTYILIIHI